MLNQSEPAPNTSESLQLKIAHSLRGTNWIIETAAPAGTSCAVCGSKLPDSAPVKPMLTSLVYASANRAVWVCYFCQTKFRKAASWTLQSPFMRHLVAPITTDQLSPLDPRCGIVQLRFAPDRPIPDSDLQLLAGFLRQYPDVPFRIYGRDRTIRDLEFLRYFPFVKKFQVDLWDLESLDGLRFLSPDLERLAVGSTKSKRYSVRFLERFPALKWLFLEGHSKDFEVVGQLGQLEGLILKSITLPGLSVLTRLKDLDSLDIKLGGTKDLRLLPEIGKLRYLELWLIRGLADLSSISGLVNLQHLFLQSLKQVTELPSLRGLPSLRRVTLETMKGLHDLTSISEAPALEELVVADMPQLTPEAFRPFVGHPTLRAASIGLGSFKRNGAARALLGLPKVAGRFEFAAKQAG
jgi:hypothetical protein